MKVYIAGPMTGIEGFNYPAFRAAARAIYKAGNNPVSPLDNGAPVDDSWDAHMRADLRLLTKCDSIHFLPGWRQSKGARLEAVVAKALGIQRVDLDGSLCAEDTQ